MTAPLTGGGRNDGGSDATAVPLVAHPASRLFPAMTNDEFIGLCKAFVEGDPHHLIETAADHLNLTRTQRACLAVELAEWYEAGGGT